MTRQRPVHFPIAGVSRCAKRLLGRPRVLATVLLIVTAGTSIATPPTPPWRAWERVARVDGAAAVRDNYRQELDYKQRQLELIPNDPSVDNFSQRLVLTATMIEYLESWSLVESRDIHAGANGREQFGGTVWPQLINYTAAMLRGHRELVSQSRKVKAARAADARPHWSFGMADNLHKNVDGVAWRLALLGKIADDASHVRGVFTLFGGRIGIHASPEAFLAAEQDIPRLIRVAPLLDAGKSDFDVRVGPARQESARTFISRFFAAVSDPNNPTLNDLIAGLDFPVAVSAQELRDKLSGADVATAQYQFAALARDEFVARVDGVITVRGRDSLTYVRNLAFRFRAVDAGLKLLSIGGL